LFSALVAVVVAVRLRSDRTREMGFAGGLAASGEARLAVRLSHPNIVHIHELGREGDLDFIVMEHVPGVSLHWLESRLLDTGARMPLPLVGEVGLQVLAGLDRAHRLTDERGRALGIVHRDVSPHNILVTEAGVVKLLDFGIARAADRTSHTATGALKGKIPYLAPEQAAGQTVDGRTDLFALGVVLYELACGQRPFEGPNDMATLLLISEGRVVPPGQLVPGFDPAMEAFILGALARSADDRFASAVDMRAALQRVLEARPGAAGPADLGRLVREQLERAERADEGPRRPSWQGGRSSTRRERWPTGLRARWAVGVLEDGCVARILFLVGRGRHRRP
jgi:serine/threonine-protein kinase